MAVLISSRASDVDPIPPIRLFIGRPGFAVRHNSQPGRVERLQAVQGRQSSHPFGFVSQQHGHINHIGVIGAFSAYLECDHHFSEVGRVAEVVSNAAPDFGNAVTDRNTPHSPD